MILIHDFAYKDMTFGGYEAPSVIQVEGAKEVAVEFFTMSKSYNMAGWRCGFCLGNPANSSRPETTIAVFLKQAKISYLIAHDRITHAMRTSLNY